MDELKQTCHKNNPGIWMNSNKHVLKKQVIWMNSNRFMGRESPKWFKIRINSGSLFSPL